MDGLDSKQNMDQVKKAGALVVRVLSQYGEPTLSLDELRAELEKELKGVSLTELILRDREAGW